MAQRLKHLPGMLETGVRSLGQEDPLEKEMATHSSTLAWRIPWREEPGRLQSMGRKDLDTTERLHFHFFDSSCPFNYCLFLLFLEELPALFNLLLCLQASAWNAGDPGSIPGSGRSPGEGNGNPLQYSCLENPMEGGTW